MGVGDFQVGINFQHVGRVVSAGERIARFGPGD